MILNKISTLMIRVAVNNTDFNITSPFLNDSNTNVATDHSGALIAGITVVCVLVLLGLGYSKFSQSIMFRNTVLVYLYKID